MAKHPQSVSLLMGNQRPVLPSYGTCAVELKLEPWSIDAMQGPSGETSYPWWGCSAMASVGGGARASHLIGPKPEGYQMEWITGSVQISKVANLPK